MVIAISAVNTFSHCWRIWPTCQTRFLQNVIYRRSSSLFIQSKLYHNRSYENNRINVIGSQYSRILTNNYSKKTAVEDEISRTKSLTTSPKEEDEWSIVYRFKHIIAARTIQKMKLYQTLFTCFFVTPVSAVCFHQGVLDQNGFTFIIGGTLIACGMLYVMGNTFGRLVGIIYSSDKDPLKVKVARLTFWGNRLNTVYPINDFVPLSDYSVNPRDIYFPIKQYSNPETTMYLSFLYGVVVNLDEFERIFGDIPPDWKTYVHKDDSVKTEKDSN